MTSLPDLIARLKIEVSHYKDCSGDIPLNVDVEDIERLLEAAERADAVDRLFAGMADPQKEIADLRSKLAKSQEETAAIVNSTLKELDETRAKLAAMTKERDEAMRLNGSLQHRIYDLESGVDNDAHRALAQRDQLARDAEGVRGRAEAAERALGKTQHFWKIDDIVRMEVEMYAAGDFTQQATPAPGTGEP